MIVCTTLPDDPVQIFTISGKLSASDYEDVLIPRIDEMVKRAGKARVLIRWKEDFKGWEAKAMLDDARLGFAHWNDFERLALIGAPHWVEPFAKLFDAVSKGAVKTFDEGAYEDALAWAKG